MSIQTPSLEDILNAYCNGIFPMAMPNEQGDEEVGWFDPPERGIIPLAPAHIPRSLIKYIKQNKDNLLVTVNHDFDAVIRSCAAPSKGREETWINNDIIGWFNALHRAGFAHSIELRLIDDMTLIGGLYGLSIGDAFFGESMFSKQPQASKVVLATLMCYMLQQGMTLLDTQFVNDHLLQFGCVEIPKSEYLARLHKAIRINKNFLEGVETIQKHDQNYMTIPLDLVLRPLN